MTGRLDAIEAAYTGIVSAGTFTLGHVGPGALDEVLRILRSGGLCVIHINAKHYAAVEFADKFDELSEQITD